MNDAAPIIIDLNRLRLRDYNAFVAGDADVIGILAQVVVAWPYPGSPDDPQSYADLGLLDLITVQRALRAAIAEAVQDLGN